MRTLDSTVTDWPLRSRGSQLLFLGAAVLLALLPAFEAARIAVALILAASPEPGRVREALTLDPDNADIEHRLGMMLFYSERSAKQDAGLPHLRRATELDPREGLYWSDLASACEASGDASCADGAVTRALRTSPMTPRLYWSAANQELRAGRPAHALGLFQQLLDLDPGYAEPVFRVCLRLLGSRSAGQIVANTRNPHLEVTLVRLMSRLNADDSAYAEWQRMAAEGRADADHADMKYGPLGIDEVAPYVEHLIDAGRESEARAVWGDLERWGVVCAPDCDLFEARAGSGGDNLVFNGGFERNPLNAGLDWRYHPQPFVSAGLSDVAPHTGSHALRIEFTGDRNQEYEPISEIVPVESRHPYELRAFVRSQAIASDTGPHLRIREFACPSPACLDVSTASTVSTTSWHEVRVSFTTGPKTSFVRVSVWRPRSRGYPSEISGTFWVDDVSITSCPPAASADGGASRASAR
jgi:hypothetical protein